MKERVDLSKQSYYDLFGKYLFRPPYIENSPGAIYKITDKGVTYFMHWQIGRWEKRSDLFGDITGMTGDGYPYYFISEEEAMRKISEQCINLDNLFGKASLSDKTSENKPE